MSDIAKIAANTGAKTMSEVTQADRKLYGALFKARPDDDGFDEVLERGGFDDTWPMQEIARHRIAAEQAQAATIENLRETLTLVKLHCNNYYFTLPQALRERVSQALKETSEHRSKDDE